ncbi:MAG TPA: TIR domain-containing protein [Candidatus Binataceae bacterium]
MARHQIFISHDTHDQRAATAVCKALEDAGIPCWIASRDLTRDERSTASRDRARNAI